MNDIVSTQWLADHLNQRDVRVVDATRHHFEPERNSATEYEEGHISGAVFLDLVELVDAESSVPNTLPTVDHFTRRMRELGLDKDQHIIVYDNSIVKTAGRAWFMFRMFGFTNVSLLDGGVAKWKAEGRPLISGTETYPPSQFVATLDPARLKDKAQILANIESHEFQHVDGRGAAHFTGAEEDPDPSLASGHVPGSVNVPFWDLFNANGTFRDPSELRAAFEQAGVDLNKPITTSCGGGVVACSLALALRLIGKDDVALYDGSWNEWGADPALPKEKGPFPS